ncbi:hypothetical protein GCM10009530_62420 [Microbispora corallina]|uniref:Uncharacterized protein n=1 Tax=Microbispora corallina TaxID=83302 RepID=A0ABQ4G7X3_9ACTN|nr:hypothetical protein Mco01_61170 [Microbispora corallina]
MADGDALPDGYLLSGTMRDERPFVVALDVVLDRVNANIRAPVARFDIIGHLPQSGRNRPLALGGGPPGAAGEW